MDQTRKKAFLTRSKSAIFIFAAFGLGVVFATGVAHVLEKTESPTVVTNPADFRDVFVLKKDINNGQTLSPDDFVVSQYLKEKVPKGAIKTYQQIETRTTKLDLPKGTVLIDDYFVSRNAKSNDSGFIPPGYHSVSIRVYEPLLENSGERYAMSSGDRVDVIVTQMDEETGETSGEVVLFEKIPILEANWENEENKSRKKGEVNLLLSDSQTKNLHETLNENTKIRLRICPPESAKTAGESSRQDRQRVADQLGIADQRTSLSEDQPTTLARVIPSKDQIVVIFGNKPQHADEQAATTQASVRVLKPAGPNESPVTPLRGIPQESYTREYAVASQHTFDNSQMIRTPFPVRPAPKYTSFYGSSDNQGQSDMQWQHVAPPRLTRSPVVFEAPAQDFPEQVRGVYRHGGGYYVAVE